MNVPLFLARRFLAGRRGKLLGTVSTLALLGVALGAAALVVAMGLMSGYRHDRGPGDGHAGPRERDRAAEEDGPRRRRGRRDRLLRGRRRMGRRAARRARAVRSARRAARALGAEADEALALRRDRRGRQEA